MWEGKDIANRPIEWEDRILILFGEKFSAGEHIPHNYDTALISSCQVLSWNWHSHTKYRWLVTFVYNWNVCWERFQQFGIWQFGNQTIRVNIQLSFFNTRTQVQIQTSLESLLNQFVIERNLSYLIERLRQKVELAVLLIHLLPLFLLFRSQQILLWWIIRLIMIWKFLSHWCNIDDTSLFDGATGPSIKQLLLLLFFFILIVPWDSSRKKSI